MVELGELVFGSRHRLPQVEELGLAAKTRPAVDLIVHAPVRAAKFSDNFGHLNDVILRNYAKPPKCRPTQ